MAKKISKRFSKAAAAEEWKKGASDSWGKATKPATEQATKTLTSVIEGSWPVTRLNTETG